MMRSLLTGSSLRSKTEPDAELVALRQRVAELEARLEQTGSQKRRSRKKH